ncbi:MAG: HEPN domain-containing protein [Endomicrobium sp.]|jgi:uncharacterized protein (UPF0332 family)|nr:HEPN domain-containing protein [Endomicrobium sp.]
MLPHKDDLKNIAIEKSDTALKSAEINIENNMLETALNRIYYSIFYIVSALAYKHDFSTSKHSRLMGWFNQKFVHEDKIFSQEIAKTYGDAFEYRQKSDYNFLYVPTVQEVKHILADVKEFIENIKKVI